MTTCEGFARKALPRWSPNAWFIEIHVSTPKCPSADPEQIRRKSVPLPFIPASVLVSCSATMLKLSSWNWDRRYCIFPPKPSFPTYMVRTLAVAALIRIVLWDLFCCFGGVVALACLGGSFGASATKPHGVQAGSPQSTPLKNIHRCGITVVQSCITICCLGRNR